TESGKKDRGSPQAVSESADPESQPSQHANPIPEKTKVQTPWTRPSLPEGTIWQSKRPTPKRILTDRAPSQEDRADLRVRQAATHLAGDDCAGHPQACHGGQLFGVARSLGTRRSTEPQKRSEPSDTDIGQVCPQPH